MKSIVLEHAGTEYYTEFARKLQTLLEFEHDLSVEQMIGRSDDNLTLYSKNEETGVLEKIVSMEAMPSKASLQLYINLGM